MRDDTAVYVILGVENQTNIHYAMPVRCGFYDFANYKSQVDKIANRNRKLSRQHKISLQSPEFLSGFRREDRLIPVITMTVYFGAELWNGPRKLTDMFEPLPDEHLLRFVNDYKINLLAPAEINDDDLSKFLTGLGLVLNFIKKSKDKKKMRELASDKRYAAVDIEDAELMKAVTGNDFEFVKEGGKVNMCKGMADWKEEIQEETTKDVLKAAIGNIMVSLNCSLERAMDVLKIPEEDRYMYRNSIQ